MTAIRKPIVVSHLTPLKPELLAKVSRSVSEITGVQLGERQRGMVEGRLRKRISDLGLDDDAYDEHLDRNRESELQALVGLLTTHHTYFFREFSHFEYLETGGLAEIVAAARADGRKTLRVWSAAASTGQEAYSLSMFLRYHLAKVAPDFGYEIFGTDVDPRSIGIARNGVYARKEIKDIPLQYMNGAWVRGTGEISEFVKAKTEIRQPCRFEVGNLLELPAQAKGEAYDLIFCRNVFIYFDADQVMRITRALVERLAPAGRLFLGISESLRAADVRLRSHGPSIYGHLPAALPVAAAKSPAKTPTLAPVAPLAPPRPLRVLCVDDSPSVLTLLKQVLKTEFGYEVVGTAKNGVEAAKLREQLRPDVMTLDIHMPEMDGLTYLKKNHGPGHPPVIMVTSVSRDDADLALQCITAGASDYVEKPAFANLAERGEELRAKLGSAYRSRAASAPKDLSLERAFANSGSAIDPAATLRIAVTTLADWKRTAEFLGSMPASRTPTLILVDGGGSALASVAQSLEGRMGGATVRHHASLFRAEDAPIGRVIVGEFQALYESARNTFGSRRASILVFGRPTAPVTDRLGRWKDAQILVEDTGPGTPTVAASDRVPVTSFAYMSSDFLGRKNG
ncbi:MAG: response regulator [Bdellovibrionales bacterium]|nr:response regulator [Bdellovibrionales bacterium]